jgi:hypothetical protein
LNAKEEGMDPKGEPVPSTAEQFQAALATRLTGLMATIRFGAAADLYNEEHWEKPEPKSESLHLKTGKSPSEAIEQLVTYKAQLKHYVGLESAKLDCVEIIEVARWFAELDVIGKEAFDKKYGGELFALAAPGSTGVHGTSLATRVGGRDDGEYNSAGGPVSGKMKLAVQGSVPSLVDLATCLASAPVGSRVMWRNFDPNVPHDDDFKNENTLKIGADRYAAHPLGIFGLAEMAAKVGTGGYTDMVQLVKETTEALDTATKELATVGDDKAREDRLAKRVRRCQRTLKRYKGIDDLASYVDRFIRLVEIETFVVPC